MDAAGVDDSVSFCPRLACKLYVYISMSSTQAMCNNLTDFILHFGFCCICFANTFQLTGTPMHEHRGALIGSNMLTPNVRLS